MGKTAKDPADYILPLYINGLNGRMMHLPAPKNKKREILFIYGQHSSIERWWGLSQAFNRYGAVTMPDLPGFGGMDSLYKIGEQASIDNLADYLAAFVKLRYKHRRMTIVGMSLGFAVVTRMLQKYPELCKKVDMLVSVVGFTHRDDFVFTKKMMFLSVMGSRICSTRFMGGIGQNIILRPFVIRNFIKHTYASRDKLDGKHGDEYRDLMQAETVLWRINDIRTQMKTNVEMLTLDNTKQRVELPVWHVSVKKDRYFNHVIVEEHMRRVFPVFHDFVSPVESHAPSIIADMDAGAKFLPKKLTQILGKP